MKTILGTFASVGVIVAVSLCKGISLSPRFYAPYYWVAYGQTQSRYAFSLFVLFFLFFIFFFFRVGKSLVTPLVSGVFVYRAFCAYFLRIERVVELLRFLWWTQ